MQAVYFRLHSVPSLNFRPKGGPRLPIQYVVEASKRDWRSGGTHNPTAEGVIKKEIDSHAIVCG